MKRKITALLVMVMMIINSGLISSAEEIKAKNSQQQAEPIEVKETIGNSGLMGYYYTDTEFQNIAMIQPVVNGELDVPQDLDMKIKSAYWYGYFVPQQSGEYKISTSNENVVVKIDGQDITEGIELEEGTQYKVSISYSGNGEVLTNLSLYWKTPADANKMNVPNNSFSLPTFNNDVSGEAHSFVLSSPLSASPFSDSDNDSIPDSMETNGFCLIPDANGVPRLVAWNDSYNGRYIKYVTSPNKWSTDDDPYSDFMETSKINMDPNVDIRAGHPLVAAYPIVSSSVEKFNISMNRDVNNQEGSATTVSVTTDSGGSKTITDEHSHSISQTASVGTDGIGVSATHSHSYTHSEANTTTWNTSNQNANEKSWVSTIGMNEAISAYFGINVRFYNMGTAPIYRSRPVISLVLEDGRVDNTLYTIHQLAARVPDIMSNSSYPVRGQAAIAMNTYDNLGSQTMTLDKDTVTALQDAGSFRVETNQLRGQIAYYDNSGNITTRNEWSNYIARINQTTAKIILDSKQTGVQVRNVAARGTDSSNPVSLSKPDMTIKEALKLAYGAVESGNNIILNGYTMDKSKIVVGFPDSTKSQLTSQSGKKFLDMLLRPGMKIYIKFLDPDQSTIEPQLDDVYVTYGDDTSNNYRDAKGFMVFKLNQKNPYSQIKNIYFEYTDGSRPINISDINRQDVVNLCNKIGMSPQDFRRDEYVVSYVGPYDTTANGIKVEYIRGKTVSIPIKLKSRDIVVDASRIEASRFGHPYPVLQAYAIGNQDINQTMDYKTINDSVTGIGYDQFNFSSGWKKGSNGSFHGGDYTNSDTKDATLEFKFKGEIIEVNGWTGSAEGRAEVYIDGKYMLEISNTPYYQNTSKRDVLYRSHLLPKGNHTLKIKVLGAKDSPPGYTPTHSNVTIDYVRVGTRKSNIPLVAQYVTVQHSAVGSGINQFKYDDKWVAEANNHHTKVLSFRDEAEVEMRFEGKKIELFGNVLGGDSDDARADVYIDDVYVGRIGRKFGNIFTSQDLGYGTHKIMLRVFGDGSGQIQKAIIHRY